MRVWAGLVTLAVAAMACGTTTQPGPDIAATVQATEARVSAVEATVTALEATIAARFETLALPTATPVPAPEPTPQPPDPPAISFTHTLNTVYYTVSGRTTDEIFGSVESNGPDFQGVSQGQFTSGLTQSAPSYESTFLDGRDSCALQSVMINVDLVVTLPRHSNTSSLPNLQLTRWQNFVDRVAEHEQRHVDIYVETIEGFKNTVEDLPQTFSDCNALEARLASIWERQLALDDEQQNAFHESEEQLARTASEPLQERIDANALKLAELQDELTLSALQITQYQTQIDDLAESISDYDARLLRNLQARLSGRLTAAAQADTFTADSLSRARRRLNDGRNELIGDLNELVQQHNETVEESNRLIKQANLVIDQLAWLR